MDIISNPEEFFSNYIRLTGVAHLGPEPAGDARLLGKRLGLLNGSSWVTAWSNYFGRRYLPGVQLVNIGNDAVQLNFMQAHEAGLPCPPQANIDRFTRYAIDLVELAQVHAVLITCSTMNRSYPAVAHALEPYHVPVVQIDMPMFEQAVSYSGKVLVIATHGPTVASTQAMLEEVAQLQGKIVSYDGVLSEEAWACLAQGNVEGHNRVLADVIQERTREGYGCIVLAQLSMSAFLFTYPDPQLTFGIPVLTSGECGFKRVREVLLGLPEDAS
jgi:hypothetical protein